MSVHGEFGRALEGVIDALRASREPAAEAWRTGLQAARVESQPDLSSAARAALAIVEAMEDPPERIAEASDHLARHCRVILGLPVV